MDGLAKRLRDGSTGDETQKIQERVLARLGEALRQEKAAKRDRERLLVAPGVEQICAVQERIARDVMRLARLGGADDKELAAQLGKLGDEQARAAQMLRDLAQKCEPAR